MFFCGLLYVRCLGEERINVEYAVCAEARRGRLDLYYDGAYRAENVIRSRCSGENGCLINAVDIYYEGADLCAYCKVGYRNGYGRKRSEEYVYGKGDEREESVIVGRIFDVRRGDKRRGIEYDKCRQGAKGL